MERGLMELDLRRIANSKQMPSAARARARKLLKEVANGLSDKEFDDRFSSIKHDYSEHILEFNKNAIENHRSQVGHTSSSKASGLISNEGMKTKAKIPKGLMTIRDKEFLSSLPEDQKQFFEYLAMSYDPEAKQNPRGGFGLKKSREWSKYIKEELKYFSENGKFKDTDKLKQEFKFLLPEDANDVDIYKSLVDTNNSFDKFNKMYNSRIAAKESENFIKAGEIDNPYEETLTKSLRDMSDDAAKRFEKSSSKASYAGNLKTSDGIEKKFVTRTYKDGERGRVVKFYDPKTGEQIKPPKAVKAKRVKLNEGAKEGEILESPGMQLYNAFSEKEAEGRKYGINSKRREYKPFNGSKDFNERRKYIKNLMNLSEEDEKSIAEKVEKKFENNPHLVRNEISYNDFREEAIEERLIEKATSNISTTINKEDIDKLKKDINNVKYFNEKRDNTIEKISNLEKEGKISSKRAESLKKYYMNPTDTHLVKHKKQTPPSVKERQIIFGDSYIAQSDIKKATKALKGEYTDGVLKVDSLDNPGLLPYYAQSSNDEIYAKAHGQYGGYAVKNISDSGGRKAKRAVIGKDGKIKKEEKNMAVLDKGKKKLKGSRVKPGRASKTELEAVARYNEKHGTDLKRLPERRAKMATKRAKSYGETKNVLASKADKAIENAIPRGSVYTEQAKNRAKTSDSYAKATSLKSKMQGGTEAARKDLTSRTGNYVEGKRFETRKNSKNLYGKGKSEAERLEGLVNSGKMNFSEANSALDDFFEQNRKNKKSEEVLNEAKKITSKIDKGEKTKMSTKTKAVGEAVKKKTENLKGTIDSFKKKASETKSKIKLDDESVGKYMKTGKEKFSKATEAAKGFASTHKKAGMAAAAIAGGALVTGAAVKHHKKKKAEKEERAREERLDRYYDEMARRDEIARRQRTEEKRLRKGY